MPRTPTTAGNVEARETSIRIRFTYKGKQRNETVMVDGRPLPPTPPNLKYARRLAIEIRAKLREKTFVYADYFPHSPIATAPDPAAGAMLHATMDRWLELVDLSASTKKQYGVRLRTFWKKALPDRPIAQVKYSDILEALNSGTWKSAKSRNNELSTIRQVFEFARRDKLVADNPCEDIERAKHQRAKPDPFSQAEAGLIVQHLRAHQHEQLANFVEFKFMTGLRTNEAIGLRWSAVDFRRKEFVVSGGIVYEEETDQTKTATERTVKLNSVALAVLTRQKAHTYLQGDFVFHDPATGLPWAYQRITDARVFWIPTLKRLGIRYRAPYNTRHTYATIGLMADARPAFLAKQLGHSLKMFFEVYADWIEGEADDREMEKIEAALRISPGVDQAPTSASNGQ